MFPIEMTQFVVVQTIIDYPRVIYDKFQYDSGFQICIYTNKWECI